jgi:hypothetical protein
MLVMLRCPSCNEVITANPDDSARCKYCSLSLNRDTLLAEVAKFEHVSSAVSQANTIKSFNAGLIIVGILCIYLLLSGASGLQRVYIHFLPIGGLVWVISWFFRFGSLQSKDPDWEPARAAMNRSILMWSIGFIVYCLCVMWALFGYPLIQIGDVTR